MDAALDTIESPTPSQIVEPPVNGDGIRTKSRRRVETAAVRRFGKPLFL
jgi:hypothetical protein